MSLLNGGGGGDRTAFRLWPVHEHRGRVSTISALALSADGSKLFIGEQFAAFSNL